MSLLQEQIHDERHPVGSHLGLMVGYNAALGALAAAGEATGRLPERLPFADVLMLGITIQKLSRIVATERVSEPLRAPFVEQGDGGEEPTGKGLQRALGELLTCPFCTGPWVGLGLAAALVTAPRPTRFLCGLFTALTVADATHRGYSTLRSVQQRERERAQQAQHDTRRA